MAARRTTFGKLQRDRAKKAKAAAKRERRQERLAEPGGAPQTGHAEQELSQAEVIRRLQALHERFGEDAVGLEEFEEQKAALLARLSVD